MPANRQVYRPRKIPFYWRLTVMERVFFCLPNKKITIISNFRKRQEIKTCQFGLTIIYFTLDVIEPPRKLSRKYLIHGRYNHQRKYQGNTLFMTATTAKDITWRFYVTLNKIVVSLSTSYDHQDNE